jgi:hypothetical protein
VDERKPLVKGVDAHVAAAAATVGALAGDLATVGGAMEAGAYNRSLFSST